MFDERHYFEVESIVEENTRYLQIRINYKQFNDDSGSVYIDNLSITTNNTRLILLDEENIEDTTNSIDASVFTEPYDFSERETLVLDWSVNAKDNFSQTSAVNGPVRIQLNKE